MYNITSYFKQMLLLLAAITLTSTATADPSNKWRLQFKGSAESAGDVVIQIAPEGARAFSITVAIEEGLSENKVAKEVVTILEATLPEDIYKVERDDGEDVLIKRRYRKANFSVSIVSNSVKNIEIELERE